MYNKRKAQSIIEFVMLFAIVAAAIMATYKYIYRSMNARLKQAQEELTYTDPSIHQPGNITGGGGSGP